MAAAGAIRGLLYRGFRPVWRRLPWFVRCRVESFVRGESAFWRALPDSVRGPTIRLVHGGYPDGEARAQVVQGLAERLGAGPGPSVCFLPSLTWYHGSFQRPQQMARALAEVGCPVLYYEPWFLDAATTAEGLRQRDFFGFRDLQPRLHLLRCHPLLFAECLAEQPPDSLILLWPDQTPYIPRDYPGTVVYEIIDDHSLVEHADDQWHRTHQHWLRQAGVVVGTADDILATLRPDRLDTLLLPNGVRAEDWVVPPDVPVPADLAAARKAPVVVGYYGSIANWFDWDLWQAAARLRPDWSFVLIGYPYHETAEAIAKRVSLCPNMVYLGAKPYGELPAYLAHFDVATIPFLLNPITHACSPVKLFEYFAGGKPVVATPMREILKYQSVLTADTPEGFVARLEEALRLRGDPKYQATLKAEAEGNTWRSRAGALRQAIEAARRQRQGTAGPAPAPAPAPSH